ncbi:hypothetical protein ACHAXR_008698 [Thalassiosira sp. AJA248-18]
MTLGPSRRSRLAFEQCIPYSSANTNSEHDPNTATRTNRNRPRRVEFPYTMDDKVRVRKPSRGRTPFLGWLVAISIYYSCIMFMHMSSYRVLSASFDPKRLTNPKPHEEKSSQSSQKESSMMKRDEKNNEIMQDNENNIVHVVETRFMQGQSHLLELGLARLALFQAFCLPSIVSQTSGNFIWIIRADPNLHPALSETMVQLLEGKQNFILIGSNSNPEGFGRSPESPFETFLLDAPVWSGNISLVEEAYKKSAAGAVLLETRLDADDGLAHNFVKTVQKEAIKYLADSDHSKEPNDRWRLWCIHSNIEWHPLNPYPETEEVKADNQTIPEGYLVLYSDSRICHSLHGISLSHSLLIPSVTPGLTFGYGPGASRASLGVDRLRHDRIVRTIEPCKKKKKNDTEVKCMSRLTELVPGAVRARTTTSAGMSNVVTGQKDFDKSNALKSGTKNKKLIQQYFQQEKLWKGLSLLFSVSRHEAIYARSVIVQRMNEIAEDNLRGQCSAGHSCKDGTQSVLKRMAEG